MSDNEMPGDDPVRPRTVAFRKSMWKAIEDFRHREGKVTMADAIRDLVRNALREEERTNRGKSE